MSDNSIRDLVIMYHFLIFIHNYTSIQNYLSIIIFLLSKHILYTIDSAQLY